VWGNLPESVAWLQTANTNMQGIQFFNLQGDLWTPCQDPEEKGLLTMFSMTDLQQEPVSEISGGDHNPAKDIKTYYMVGD
jgi:hypothetical protein